MSKIDNNTSVPQTLNNLPDPDVININRNIVDQAKLARKYEQLESLMEMLEASLNKFDEQSLAYRSIKELDRSVALLRKVAPQEPNKIEEFAALVEQSCAEIKQQFTMIKDAADRDRSDRILSEQKQSRMKDLEKAAEWLAKADAFAKKHAYFSENTEPLFDYIKNILENPDFQRDPKEFILQWAERRGHTEEFRFPEDVARTFFGENFMPKIAASLASDPDTAQPELEHQTPQTTDREMAAPPPQTASREAL